MPDIPTKMLIVEDEPEILDGLSAYATKQGYEVHTALDGLTAVEIGNDVRPDIILLDIALPGLDGRDVLVEFNKTGVAQNAVVIFLTARDDQSDRLVGFELGASAYETKPLYYDLLFSRIEHLLEKARAENE